MLHLPRRASKSLFLALLLRLTVHLRCSKAELPVALVSEMSLTVLWLLAERSEFFRQLKLTLPLREAQRCLSAERTRQTVRLQPLRWLLEALYDRTRPKRLSRLVWSRCGLQGWQLRM